MTATSTRLRGRPGPADRPAAPRRRVPLWVAIVAASLPMFMATLDNLVMTSALPVIQADLGSSVGQLSWFMNAYTLSFATFMLPAATLGDRLGRRRMMLAGITRLHAGLDRLRAEHHLRGADRGPGGPGPRGGRDHAALADPARGRGAAGHAGRRDRHLGRRLRPRRRARPGDRRRRRRGRQLAGDLLAQRPGRARRPAAAAPRGPRVARHLAAARPGRHAAARRRGVPRHLGDRARQRRRLDRPRVLGPLVARRAAGPGVRPLGPRPRPTPCCRCGCSPRAASRSPT